MNRKPDPAALDARPLSFKRWSQRKLEARRAELPDKDEPAAPPSATAPTPPSANVNANANANSPVTLPPIESLTPESDFTAFFSVKTPVDDALKRAALKTLLRDPRFNVMDGLDTYIDDYTREDPIPESVLRRMAHAQQFLPPELREVPPPAELESVDTPSSLAADVTPEPAASAQPATPLALPDSDSTAEAHDPAPADAPLTAPTSRP